MPATSHKLCSGAIGMNRLAIGAVLASILACSVAQTDSEARTLLLQLDRAPIPEDVDRVVAAGGGAPQVIAVAQAISVYGSVAPREFDGMAGLVGVYDLGATPNPIRSVFVELTESATEADVAFIASKGGVNTTILEDKLITAEMRLNRIADLGSSDRVSRVVIGQDDNVPQ